MASNILFIYLLPLNVAPDFLTLYPLISAIFGILTIYFGARGSLKAFGLYSAFIVIPIAVLMLEFSLIVAISIFYVWVIYMADYLSSQSFQKRGLISYRCLNSLCIFPLILNYESMDGFYISIGFRIAISLFVIGFTVSKKINSQKLNIISPIQYIITTHVAYFLPLFLVTQVTSLEGIKTWYIFNQIILGIYLKYFDYRIRSNETIKIFEQYRCIFLLIILISLFCINIISFNVINTIIIISSLCALRLVSLKYFSLK